MNESKLTPPEAADAREVLAPLYGEAPELPPDRANEYEATRDLLRDWMNPIPADEAIAESRRQVMLDAITTLPVAARATAIIGTVWVLRSGARNAMPLADNPELRPGDRLQTPRGCRAMVKFTDGSTVLVREESELEIGAPEGAGERLSVIAGRFFAWIEKQVSGHFCIRAHGGFATVVGTEFDFSADREGNVTIVVTEGQVNYRPTANDPAVIALRSQDMMEHRNTAATKRTLSARETRAYTAWAREERRGAISGKLVVSILVLAVLGGAGLYIGLGGGQDEIRSSIGPTGKKPAATAQGAPTAQAFGLQADGTFNYVALLPEGEHSRNLNDMVVSMPSVGEVRQQLTAVARRAPGGNTIEMTIEEAKATKPDGSPLDPSTGSYGATITKMKGVRIAMERVGDSYVDRTESITQESDPFTRAMFLIQMNASPSDRAGLKKGDTWTEKRKGRFDAGGAWEIEMRFRYDGIEERNGRQLAVIHSEGTTAAKELTMLTIPAPNYTTAIIVNPMTTRGTARMFFEPVSARLVEMEMISENTIELVTRTDIKGREPLIQKGETVKQTQRGTLTWEYLP